MKNLKGILLTVLMVVSFLHHSNGNILKDVLDTAKSIVETGVDAVEEVGYTLTGAKKTVEEAEKKAQKLQGETKQIVLSLLEELDVMLDEKIRLIEASGENVVNLAFDELHEEIQNVEKIIKDVTNQIDTMLEENINCFSLQTAENIKNFYVRFYSAMDSFDASLSAATDNLYAVGLNWLDNGAYKVGNTLNTTLITFSRIASFVVACILLIAFAFFYKRKMATILKILSSIFFIGFFVFALSLTFSQKIAANVFGTEIELPNRELACEQSISLFNEFQANYRGYSIEELRFRGKELLNYITICKYAQLDAVSFSEYDGKAEIIKSVLYAEKIIQERESALVNIKTCDELTEGDTKSKFDIVSAIIRASRIPQVNPIIILPKPNTLPLISPIPSEVTISSEVSPIIPEITVSPEVLKERYKTFIKKRDIHLQHLNIRS